MLRSRRDLPILVVALVGFALISVALAVGGPSTQTQQLASGPKSKQREVKNDTYSGLVREMEHKRVLSAAVDVGTSKAKVLYQDGRYVEVALPPDNGALLRQLASSGASVTIEGEPKSGGDSGKAPAAGTRERVWVGGYSRADGTKVQGYYRATAGNG